MNTLTRIFTGYLQNINIIRIFTEKQLIREDI